MVNLLHRPAQGLHQSTTSPVPLCHTSTGHKRPDAWNYCLWPQTQHMNRRFPPLQATRGGARRHQSERSPKTTSSPGAKPGPRLAEEAQKHRQQAVSSGAPVNVGQELEVECARLALEGKGVCLLPPTGFVVLVERALPGERVRAEVVAVKRGYAEARKLASLAPHRHAVPAPCHYFGPCGGCTLQSLEYSAQLREKRNQVEQTLRRVGRLGAALDHIAAQPCSSSNSSSNGDCNSDNGNESRLGTVAPSASTGPADCGIPSSGVSSSGVSSSVAGGAFVVDSNGGSYSGRTTTTTSDAGREGTAGEGDGARSGLSPAVAPTVGCREPFGYRNKMMFHFSARCWVPPGEVVAADRPALGFLRAGTADEVLPVTQHGCSLQGPVANSLLARIADLVSERGLLPYNHPSGKGFLKHLVIRRGSGGAPPQSPTAPQPIRTGPSEEEEVEEYMAVFGVTHGSAVQQLKPLAQVLATEFPQLVSIVAQQVAPPQPGARPGGVAAPQRAAAAAAAPGPAAGSRRDKDRGRASGGGGDPERRGRSGGGGSSGNRHSVTHAAPPRSLSDSGGGSIGDTDGGDSDSDGGGGGGGDAVLLYGTPYIHDRLCGLTFRISPGSFFQTNSRQADVLYGIVRQAAGLRPGREDAVLDLYCGTGTIGLSLAADCRTVVGVDIVESAVADARRNAALNGISNAAFICCDVDALPTAPDHNNDNNKVEPHHGDHHQQGRGQQPEQPDEASSAAASSAAASSAAESPASSAGALSSSSAAAAVLAAPDVVVADPARAGLSAAAVAYLGRCGARRVVYVSCNVATQARDLDRLCNGPDAAFRLVSVLPVDMFPHTDHVETVAVLERRPAT